MKTLFMINDEDCSGMPLETRLFEVTHYMDIDVLKGLENAAEEYCNTDDGYLICNGDLAGYFEFRDADWIPSEILERHGIIKVEELHPEVVDDALLYYGGDDERNDDGDISF